MSDRPAHRRAVAGLSLIEVLLLAVAVGVLGRIALPSFGAPTALSKESAVVFRLVAVRASIERHRLDRAHAVHEPLFDGVACCTRCLPRGAPRNPVSGRQSVRVVRDLPAAPDGSTGWVYATRTGDFRANLGGDAPSGKAWFDL